MPFLREAVAFVLCISILDRPCSAGEDSRCSKNDESCPSNSGQSQHNKFMQEEFARQSKPFYESAMLSKEEQVTPLIEAADIKDSDIILDLACGPGIITTECAKRNPRKVYGMDITKEMLAIAKKHALDNHIDADKIEFVHGNVEQLPFDDNAFDIVITRWTFHHFDQLNKVMKEIYRVLKPQTGRLVFYDFCAPNISNYDDAQETKLVDVFNAMHTIRDPSHVWAYNEAGWIEQVKNGGFDVENIRIADRLSKQMNWMEFIERTNPSEDDKRARNSIHVIGDFLARCDCDVGMNFYYNHQHELMIRSDYVIVVATK